MNVLIACEESQEVCKAFRERGHNAFSCDVLECSGGHPEWHIKGDVIPYLNGRCWFKTEGGGVMVEIYDKWDLIIAHPPCTDLAVSGARWFPEKQRDLRQQRACVFFMMTALANCDHVAVENPIGIMSSVYRKPDQIIQPYMFGEPYEKKTCLWLKNLPKLIPTKIVEPEERAFYKSGKSLPSWYSEIHIDGKTIAWNDPLTARIRSRTFRGIAQAMAEQWGELDRINSKDGQMSLF